MGVAQEKQERPLAVRSWAYPVRQEEESGEHLPSYDR
jgi:hypothetical protein